MELTDWFPPEVLPVHEGVYETNDLYRLDMGFRPVYQHWNGRFWGACAFKWENAYEDRNLPSELQRNFWRGLSARPLEG